MGVHQGMIWGLVTDPTTTDDPRLVAYDPALDRWVDHGSVSRNALDVAGSAAILDGRAYLFGHAIGDPDPQLRVWTLDLDSKATSLPGDRVFSDGATAVDRTTGRIYYLTTPGEDAEGHQAPQALRIYDPRLATWRDIAPIPTDRTGALLVADGAGAAYVIGGMAIPICRDDGSGGTACDAPPVVRYDPMTDRWDMVADVPDLAPPWAAVWNEAAGAAVGADGALYLAVLEEAGPIQPGQPFELFRVGIHRLASGARAWTRPYTLPNTGVTSLFATDDGRLVLLGEGQFAASGTMNVPVWVMDLPVT